MLWTGFAAGEGNRKLDLLQCLFEGSIAAGSETGVREDEAVDFKYWLDGGAGRGSLR